MGDSESLLPPSSPPSRRASLSSISQHWRYADDDDDDVKLARGKSFQEFVEYLNVFPDGERIRINEFPVLLVSARVNAINRVIAVTVHVHAEKGKPSRRAVM